MSLVIFKSNITANTFRDMRISFLTLQNHFEQKILSLITPVLTQSDIDTTAALAHKIWIQHYVPIIGQAQVDYMLEKFQNVEAFSQQVKEGYRYYLSSHNNSCCGYLALVVNRSEHKLMVSKIYMDADFRGLGLGLEMMDFAFKEAKNENCHVVWLTVNRNNAKSIDWYKKYGFAIVEEVKIDIGNGFYMDDFVMEKSII